MATLAELARGHTPLGGKAIAHLQRLHGAWGMLADLSFADLLLFVPVAGGDDRRFIVLGQVRPTTRQTLHREDLVAASSTPRAGPWWAGRGAWPRSWRARSPSPAGPSGPGCSASRCGAK